MISYQVYKVLHLTGMFLLFTVTGAIALHVLNGGTRESNAGRKLVAALHGVAMLIILIGGFGLMARIGVPHTDWPIWIMAKFAIWAAFVFIAMLPYRVPGAARWVLLGVPLLGGMAAYLAVYKPQ